MPEYVARLVRAGMNLVDAYEIVDDFMYDEDYQGLAEYVIAYERDMKRREKNVGGI